MHRLEALFQPRSIALVGASENPEKPGHAVLRNLKEGGYGGQVYPVNPAGGKILGYPVATSMAEVPPRTDLVLISVPNPSMLQVVEEAVENEPAAIAILSAGQGGVGKEARRLHRQLRSLLAQAHCRVLGPDCMGLFNEPGQLNATAFEALPKQAGNISLISQSGAYGAILFGTLAAHGVGLCKFVSLGQQLDVGHTELLQYLGDDEQTGVIGMFIEEILDGARFMEVANQVAMKKPVVAFKAGRTRLGQKAAEIHSGASPGDPELYEAALRQSGLLVARDTGDFFDLTRALSASRTYLPVSGNVVLLSHSAGPSVIAADACVRAGLNLPRLEAKTRQTLGARIPAHGFADNPVNLTYDMKAEDYGVVLESVFADSRTGGVIVLVIGRDDLDLAEAIGEAKSRFGKPVVACLIEAPNAEAILGKNLIPVYSSPERAVRAYEGLRSYREILTLHKTRGLLSRTAPEGAGARVLEAEKPARSPKPRELSEYETKAVLREWESPVPDGVLVKNLRECNAFIRERGYPLRVKIHEGIKKSATGPTELTGLRNRKELSTALQRLRRSTTARFDFLLESDLKDRDVLFSLRLRCHRDPVFGPVLAVSFPQPGPEALQRWSMRICPLRRTDAETQLCELPQIKLLRETGELTEALLEKIASALSSLSEKLFADPSILRLELPCLEVDTQGAQLRSARMVRQE